MKMIEIKQMLKDRGYQIDKFIIDNIQRYRLYTVDYSKVYDDYYAMRPYND